MMLLLVMILFLLTRIVAYFVVSEGNFVINEGVALGLLGTGGLRQFMYVPVVTILLAALWRNYKKFRFPLFLITTGSISNLLDRLLYNGVVDYIDIWRIPVFNVSDVMIVCGILILIFSEVKNYVEQRKGRQGK